MAAARTESTIHPIMGLFTTSYSYTVILLQIVMVSPGTHLVNKSYVPLQNHRVSVKKSLSHLMSLYVTGKRYSL